MALFNHVVQIFALAHFDACVLLAIHLFETSGLGATLINIHEARLPIMCDGFVEKASCGLPISCGGVEKVDGLALLLSGADNNISIDLSPSRTSRPFATACPLVSSFSETLRLGVTSNESPND